MTSPLQPLLIRKRLGRETWSAPTEFGPDGWMLRRKDGTGSVLVTVSPVREEDDPAAPWLHASIAGLYTMPTYDDLQLLHRAVWPNGWAYQCFAPPHSHVNIHPYALHLWGRPDGRAVLPNFGWTGSI